VGVAVVIALFVVAAATWWPRPDASGGAESSAAAERQAQTLDACAMDAVGAPPVGAESERVGMPGGATRTFPDAGHDESPLPAFPESPLRTAHAAGRSPLENSPGYFPPDDPESASVRLGRREAPPVEGEFRGGAASLEDFARAFLDGLNSKDTRALEALRVTKNEFVTFLWREFPESRPITHITADDAWGLANPTSVSAMNRAMGEHGGRDLRLVRVDRERTQEFTNFDLVRGVAITARSESTGELHVIKTAPSVAVRHGRYKALLYRDK
jgi:hypothetical protein